MPVIGWRIKEGLLAPTVLFAANYLRSLSSIRQPSEVEIQSVIDQLVAEPFRVGVKKALTTNGSLDEMHHVKEVLSKSRAAIEEHKDLLAQLAPDSVSDQGDSLVLSGGLWSGLNDLAKTSGKQNETKSCFEDFSDAVLSAYADQYADLLDNKALLLRLQDTLGEKERADRILEATLASRLFLPEQIADLKGFRSTYRAVYDQWTHMLCLYFVDLPIRVRLLCVGLGVDRAKGMFKDDNKAIVKSALGMQHIAAMLLFYKDTGTQDIYTDMLLRLKGDLSSKEYDELVFRSKMAPEWFQTLSVKNLVEATGEN